MTEDATANDKLEEYKGNQKLKVIIDFILKYIFVLVLPLKFSETSSVSASHSVYMKKHRSEKKTADKPVGKTLVVLNIPPYATEDAITRVFSCAGEVDKVTLIDSYQNEQNTKYQVKSEIFNEPRPFKFQIGFVVFKKSESLDLVFRLSELPPLSTKEHPVLTGVAKYTEQYNKRMVDKEEMQKDVDLYMKHYDKVKKAADTQVDDDDGDDGWVTVGKKGNNAGFKQKESVISKLEQKLQNQRKKAKNLTNFYSFELRESKKQQLMDLRRKFEDDKLKMNSMRQNRKFKPYQ